MRGLDDVHRRLEKLERQRNHWRSVTLGMVLCGALALVVGARPAGVVDTVRAEQFIVVDSDGRPMAGFGLAKDGTAAMTLNDRTGRRRIVLSLTQGTVPSISLLDPEERERLALRLHPDLGGSVAFLGTGREKRSGAENAFSAPDRFSNLQSVYHILK